MVTSFRDGALKRLGLDYESVHERHPHLVWGQVRGYGEYGPEKDSKGFDTTAYAARGGYLASIPQANEHYQPGNLASRYWRLEFLRCAHSRPARRAGA